MGNTSILTTLEAVDSPAASPAAVLKRDTFGRVRTPKDKRETLLDEFERSGLGGTTFARLAGVHYQTFAGWMQKRRRERGQPPSALRRKSEVLSAPKQVRLVEAVMARALPSVSGSGALRVELPGGASLTVGDAAQARLAAALLKALEGARPC